MNEWMGGRGKFTYTINIEMEARRLGNKESKGMGKKQYVVFPLVIVVQLLYYSPPPPPSAVRNVGVQKYVAHIRAAI